nr:nucleoporin [Quercus suber]
MGSVAIELLVQSMLREADFRQAHTTRSFPRRHVKLDSHTVHYPRSNRPLRHVASFIRAPVKPSTLPFRIGLFDHSLRPLQVHSLSQFHSIKDDKLDFNSPRLPGQHNFTTQLHADNDINNNMASVSGKAVAKEAVKSITTERLGFRAIAGEHKLRILPTSWPDNNQPASSASLLSVASRKGLIAAAGPNTLVVGSTTDARNALIASANTNDKAVDFAPQSTISIPRVSQLTFSSDESCLVIAAEQGGGLAVYDTNQQPMKEPSFQIATNGVGVQQLLPNPNPSGEHSYYFGIILETGQLLVADLKERKLINTAQGKPVFLENVTCAAWSKLGKQIIAGRRDGTAVQIDPQGNIKAEIPTPPQMQNLAEPDAVGYPLTSVYWLENAEFLFIHSPEYAKSDGDDSMAPRQDSLLHLVYRNKAEDTYEFHTVPDPLPPGTLDNRVPARHFIQRLKDWSPHLREMLIMISTIASDAGILTKSTTALDSSVENAVVDCFTTTGLIDGRGAPLPLSVNDEMSETSAIGMAMDLSATLNNTEKITRPIPADEEFEECPVPLPALCLLNNEGLLSVWWVMYDESLYKKAIYPGMVAAATSDNTTMNTAPTMPQTSAFGMNPASNQGASNTSTFGSTSSPGQLSAFGSTPTFAHTAQKAQASNFNAASTLGQATTNPQTPTFGSTSLFGQASKSQSPFGGASAPGSSSTFGQTGQNTSNQAGAFGSPSAVSQANAFGSTSFGGASMLGKSSSPWGASTSGTTTTVAPATKPVFGSATSIGAGAGFGQIGGMGANKPSPWGTPSGVQHPVSDKSAGSTFGGNATAESPFAAFGRKPEDAKAAPFASGWGSNTTKASPFAKVAGADSQSAFEAKPSLFNEASGSTASLGSGFSFGSTNTAGAFGTPSQSSSFGKPSQSREETMDDDNPPKDEKEKTDASGLFSFNKGGFKLGSTFRGDGTAKDDLPKPESSTSSFFGNAGGFLSSLDKDAGPMPRVKQESGTANGTSLNYIPEASATSKTTIEHGKSAAEAMSTVDPLKYTPKRFANDVPPVDIPEATPATTKSDVDPLSYKPKRFTGDLPPMSVPASPAESAATQTQKEKPVPENDSHAPLSGSPPVDLGNETFSDAAASDVELPEDDDDEWGDDDDEQDEIAEASDSAEQSEEDEEDARQETDPKALADFESRLAPASPTRPQEQEESTTPLTDKRTSFTPAGFPNPPINFAPVRNMQESPRSPSPQRRSPQRANALRSVTSPMPPTSRFGRSSAGTAYSSSKPLPNETQKIVVPPARLLERLPKQQQPKEPEMGDLEDDEDARLKDLMSTKATPSRDIPEFLAHQDFAGQIAKEGLGGTIERVFCDVNSMITTLGWNARSLQSFVDGHTELKKSGSRDRSDLESPQTWVLDEVKNLEQVQTSLAATLEEGKLEHPVDKIESLREQAMDVNRIRTSIVNIRKQLAAHVDQEQHAKLQAAPLPAEAEAQQSELRQGVQKVQKLLAQIEQAMTVLRADLSAMTAADTRSAAAKNVPTVEAVTNTVLKMTAMIEKKSGDIDVLEAQIRRLPQGLSSLNLNTNYEDELVDGLKGSRLLNNSPRASVIARRPRMAANGDSLGMSGMFGSRLRTPPASRRSVMFSPETSALGRSTGSLSGSARKKMRDVTEEEIDAYEARVQSRAKVLQALKTGLDRKGARVVRVD